MGSSHPILDTYLGCFTQLLMLLTSILSESDLGLSLLEYYLETPLGAKIFPAEAASGNYVLWGRINLCLQISALFL